MNVITMEQMDSIQRQIEEQERQRREKTKRKNFLLIFQEVKKQLRKGEN